MAKKKKQPNLLTLIVSVVIVIIVVLGVFAIYRFQQREAEIKNLLGYTDRSTVSSKLPVYWEIRHDGDLQGYVIPSIHISKISYLDHIENLLQDVDNVALEVDFSEVESYILYNLDKLTVEGYHIGNFLSENAISKASDAVGSYAWNIVLNDKVPGFAASYIMNILFAQNGYTHSMDTETNAKAIELGKNVVGLEDVSLQIEFLVNETFDEYWIQTIEELFSLDNPLQSMEELEAVYSEGDLGKYRKIYQEESNKTFISYSQEIRDPVIQQRSKEVLKTGKTLIMVGALHVPDLVDFLGQDYELVEVRTKM